MSNSQKKNKKQTKQKNKNLTYRETNIILKNTVI